jgi:hypothetical protein
MARSVRMSKIFWYSCEGEEPIEVYTRYTVVSDGLWAENSPSKSRAVSRVCSANRPAYVLSGYIELLSPSGDASN